MDKLKRIELEPTHLAWLAENLRLADEADLKPSFECMLKNMPTGFFSCPAGTEIISEGEPGTDLYIVYSGRLAVTRTKGHVSPIMLGELAKGDFFGEISFLVHSARSATVKAMTECSLFKFKASTFAELMEKTAALASSIKKTARARLEKIFLGQL